MKFNESFDFREFYRERDDFFWRRVEELVVENGISIKMLLQNFMAFSQRRDLPQLLAYYELFKRVQNLPGSIVEVGVFLGNGLFTWAKLLETFCPGDRGRKVYGFDNFCGYDGGGEVDQDGIAYIKSLVGDFKVNATLVNSLVKLHNLDNLLPGVERVILFDGDLCSTLDAFLEAEIGVRLSLLLIDVSLYGPTKAALEKLFPRVVRGGIVALRGYGVKPWEGECLAVDEFLAVNNIKKIRRFPFSNYPAVYFTK